MEHEDFENAGLIAEVAGTPIPEVKMSEEQAYYLHEYIDPMVDRLIADMELEKVRRQLSDEYQRRTLKEL